MVGLEEVHAAAARFLVTVGFPEDGEAVAPPKATELAFNTTTYVQVGLMARTKDVLGAAAAIYTYETLISKLVEAAHDMGLYDEERPPFSD